MEPSETFWPEDMKDAPEKDCPFEYGDIIIWKLGNDERPASKEDLKDFADQLGEALVGKDVVKNVKSHLALNIEIIQGQCFEDYMLAWKLGSKDRSVSPDEIKDLSNDVSKLLKIVNEGDDAHFVCHHCISVEMVLSRKNRGKHVVLATTAKGENN